MQLIILSNLFPPGLSLLPHFSYFAFVFLQMEMWENHQDLGGSIMRLHH